MPPGPLKIKDNSYLTDAPQPDMPTNTETLSANTANIHAVYRVVLSLQLQHICLLAYFYWHKHRCCSSIPSGWVRLHDGYMLDSCHSVSMPVELLPFNVASLLALCFFSCHTCWCSVSLSAVPAEWCLTISHACSCGVSLNALHSSVVLHYQPRLLVWCFIIGHAFWCDTSQSAMPGCMVPHYRSCLLVWCLTLCLLVWWLTIGHVCWCSIALSAMPVSMVPYYRPCLLECYLTIGHSCWSVATATNILLVECRWKRSHYKSCATLTEVQLHQICLLILDHSQIRLLVQCNSIRYACWIYL